MGYLNLRLRLLRCVKKRSKTITDVGRLKITFQSLIMASFGYKRERCRVLGIIIRFRSLTWIHAMTMEGLSKLLIPGAVFVNFEQFGESAWDNFRMTGQDQEFKV